jgi:hypothetical protein
MCTVTYTIQAPVSVVRPINIIVYKSILGRQGIAEKDPKYFKFALQNFLGRRSRSKNDRLLLITSTSPEMGCVTNWEWGKLVQVGRSKEFGAAVAHSSDYFDVFLMF